MRRLTNYILFVALLLTTGSAAMAQTSEQLFKAAGTPVHPKVVVSWNRYNDCAGIENILKKIAKAYPNLARLESIGKSYEGRDIWCIAVSDYSKGEASKKPGMYVDGNVHSNEVQGSEFAMYIAWYMTESFDDNAFIRELLADKIIYILPTINPDGRENFLKKPNNMHTPRAGVIPVDNDLDDVTDEDGLDDLDGDGNIVQMRRKSLNGRYKIDPFNPYRMIEAGPDETGDYEMLGDEGIDNDGDGMVNEDGIQGSYDPNRNWGWNWQPNNIQAGAYKYPFSIPENRAVQEFVMKHPNIAGAQSFHNSGGLILRGPGASDDAGTYNENDVRVYDALGQKGEELIPGYKYLVIYKDLYTGFGGEIDWMYAGRGIYAFTNELWTPYLLFNTKSQGEEQLMQFDRYLLFKDAFVPWHEYTHPQYGKIEIGGFKKNFTRMHPGFLLESDAHRNMAFTLFHAYHTPKLAVDTIMEKDLGSGLTEVTAIIGNKRLMPTHASHDIKFKIERPDYISLTGVKVIAGMKMDNGNSPAYVVEQKNNPQTIELDNIPGLGYVTIRWVIRKTGKYTITVDSRKGGVASRSN